MSAPQKNQPPVAARPVVAALRGVTKVFSRTAQRAGSLKEALLTSLRQRAQRDLILALDEVSLELHAGEALGVIGPNGAGKSTLLKILAGISQPTQGAVETSGRVLGLIELGAGFHPELTGEENIRLQGALYGLERRALERKIGAILEFAGLEEFRAMPVRHYSSGMYVRLGFAIAAHAAPDLLLVDEVLSVGDLAFQERCLQTIARLREQGTALVLVTHFPEQTERFCERVAWLEAGQVRRLGPASEVCVAWQADLLERRYAGSQGLHTAETIAVPGRFGKGGARIEAVRLLDATGHARGSFRRGVALRIEIDFVAEPEVAALDCAIPLTTEDDVIVSYERAVRCGVARRPAEPAGHAWRGRFVLEYPTLPLLPGRYGLTIALSEPDNIFDHFDMLFKLVHFSIEPEPDWLTVAPLEIPLRIKSLDRGHR